MSKLILTFALLFSSFTAHAYTLVWTTPGFKGWQTNEIKLTFNPANCPNGVNVRGLIEDSIALWNSISNSGLKLVLDEDTSATTRGYPIPIICDTNYASGGPAQDSSPGVASTAPGSGEYITSALISLNASAGNANIARLSLDKVKVVLAHEMGHAIGLGHSQDMDALMYYNVAYKTNFTLGQDDIDGIAYLYPRNELGKDPMLGGCGTVHSMTLPKPPSAGQMIALLFLMLLPLAVAQRLKTAKR
ncbi:MAG: matrixin family metalloprotease [Bdellovibrionaceae bacterium]|nr:matrixin family metalloprotease [Pseudobdellovibrionaceae bacterium]